VQLRRRIAKVLGKRGQRGDDLGELGGEGLREVSDKRGERPWGESLVTNRQRILASASAVANASRTRIIGDRIIGTDLRRNSRERRRAINGARP
jgi:hypothetical protein